MTSARTFDESPYESAYEFFRENAYAGVETQNV